MKRAKGPKPSNGIRTNRIVVKYHDDELMEVLQAFEQHHQHPATWMREASLRFARKSKKP